MSRAPSSVTLTLTDDETLPTVTLALSSSSISEGNGVTTVTAALSGPSSEAVTVTVSAAPLSGATVADYALTANRTLVIAADSTASTGTVTLTAVNNAVQTADKTVTVSGAASGGNGVSAPAGLTLTITDNDGSVPTGSDTTWRNVGQTQTNWDVTTMSLVAEISQQTIEFTGGYEQGNVDVWACANKAGRPAGAYQHPRAEQHRVHETRQRHRGREVRGDHAHAGDDRQRRHRHPLHERVDR